MFPGCPAVIPAPAFTQLISSLGLANITRAEERLVRVTALIFVLTKMLKPLKAGMPVTFTVRWTCTPLATATCVDGAMKTVGVPAARVAGGVNASAIIIAARRRIDEARSLEFLLVLCT
jgi:hypothetical protein